MTPFGAITRVMFDRAKSRDFVALALREGLVTTTAPPSILKLYSGAQLSKAAKDELLLQVTAHEQILLMPEEWDLDGTLFESDAVRIVKPTELHAPAVASENWEEALCTDPYLIIELSGLDIDLGELQRRADEGRACAEEFASVFGDTPAFGVEISVAVGNRLTSYQSDVLKRYKRALESFRPVIEGVRRFANNLELGTRLNCSVYSADAERFAAFRPSSSAKLVNVATGREILVQNDTENVFEMVSCELGTMPYRTTLAETLQLSRSDECKALRQHVQHLVACLRNGEVSGIEHLCKEVTTVRKKMKNVEGWTKTADALTWIGVPVGLAGFVNPIVGAAGFGLSCLGAYALYHTKQQTKRYSWAMFGRRWT